MALYQCLFFKDGIIVDWENIEATTEDCIRAVLVDALGQNDWDLVEAWLGEALSFQIEAPPSSH